MNSNPHASGRVLHAGARLGEAKRAMILLHGRGGSAEDILGLASAFRNPEIAYLAPQASGGTWYPLSFLAPREANEPFLTSALLKVETVVRSLEDAGIGCKQIILAGFSQGACLASEFVASHPALYAGLIAFTGGLIGPPGSIELRTTHTAGPASASALGGMPALLVSGDPDPHVPWTRVTKSAEVLRAMGAEVTLKRYPGRPHTLTAAEIELARTTVLDAPRRS